MNRMTVQLPDDLKAAVMREAGRRSISQAEVIRLAVRKLTQRRLGGRHAGIITGGQLVAEHADDHLIGFGA